MYCKHLETQGNVSIYRDGMVACWCFTQGPLVLRKLRRRAIVQCQQLMSESTCGPHKGDTDDGCDAVGKCRQGELHALVEVDGVITPSQ